MKIPLKAKVTCKDGEYGSVKELLVDPVKEKVTHIVISNKHSGVEYILPIVLLDYTSDSIVSIDKTASEINKYPKFIIHDFITVPTADVNFSFWSSDPSLPHSYTMFPYVIHDGKPVIEVSKEAIPNGEFKLKRGMAIKDNTGKNVGKIDELIVDPERDHITHIVLRTGHLFGKKDVVVPNINITSFSSESITLSLNVDEIKDLPEVLIKRAWKD